MSEAGYEDLVDHGNERPLIGFMSGGGRNYASYFEIGKLGKLHQ